MSSLATILIEKIQNFLELVDIIPDEYNSTVVEYMFHFITKNLLAMRESILEQMYPNGCQEKEMAFHDVFMIDEFKDLRDVLIISQLSPLSKYIKDDLFKENPAKWFDNQFDKEKQGKIADYHDLFCFILDQ